MQTQEMELSQMLRPDLYFINIKFIMLVIFIQMKGNQGETSKNSVLAIFRVVFYFWKEFAYSGSLDLLSCYRLLLLIRATMYIV